MSERIVGLLTDPQYTSLIQQKLPPAFQTVEDQLRGNPAVGLLREQVILGMLIAFLGEANVRQVKSGVAADIDCYVDNQSLSIKTVSQSGGIRIKWTSNAVRARAFMSTYIPQSNLLVIRIAWGERGSIRYIPLTVQQRVFQRMGARYLDYRATTNTRGVNLSAQAETALNDAPETHSLTVLWRRSNEVTDPVKKWVDYWLA